ncbi:MAG: NAD(P)-dependent oxidoreductase [Leucobacter sp.]
MPTPPSRAVVIGATGFAGNHIVAELVQRGFDVTGVSRSRGDTDDEIVPFVRASIHDTGALNTLLADADTLVIAARATQVEAEGESFAAAIEQLFPQLAAHRIRVGVVGGAGSLHLPGTETMVKDGPTFNTAWMPEAIAQSAVLDALRVSPTAVDWFYLSPPSLFGAPFPGKRTGEYRLGTDELLFDNQQRSTISGEDFAVAFVDEIEHPRHRRTRFTVAY